MPQLDPAPWFMILVFTWLVFITILPSKVLTRISPNKLAQQNTQKFKTKFWDWPW
uniref:ATP synthase complex subunit 8 n=1 Tax=Odontobutis sinensis TaxID=357168 RepID=U5KR90_9GOBI|nr:ATP synthase F0 subunit 8 [Odontobutis sinensis]AGT79964.1 ATP synthase F0 subunit 8 [Odontobutis sinensis]QYK91613.1 ATP synthase F0 subunit 8 [Odontobutis sinensis]QYK91626.1 ATP synthase F0 subunit 8 [Odontobutis sinensis]